MTTFFFDTETALFGPGNMAPPLTCLAYAIDAAPPLLVDHVAGPVALRKALEAGHDIVGQNVPYDLLVCIQEDPDLLDLVFKAYDEARVHDTIIRQQLTDISTGTFRGYMDTHGVWRKRGYSLAELSQRLLGIPMDKTTYRLGYGPLRGIPIDAWEEGARAYATDDTSITRLVFHAQAPAVAALNSVAENTYAQWWLHLMSAWGVRTTPAGVESLAKATQAQVEIVRATLIDAGLIRVKTAKKTGITTYTRDTKAAKVRMLEACPNGHKLTKKEGVSLDEEACKDSGDPLLEAYAEYSTLNAVVSKDLPALAAGVNMPIHARYGMTASSRTSCSKPNMQNWRRMPGIREVFVPRPGLLLIQADYSGFELCSLAQTCLDLFGESELAKVLISGEDAHLSLAATILGIPYEEAKVRRKEHAVDEARQLAKAANFGFPGGLGCKTFVAWAKAAYGLVIGGEQAAGLKAAWSERYPEIFGRLFPYVTRLTDRGEPITLPRHGLICGGVSFTEGCNRLFQGPAARAAKRAGALIARACYIEDDSPLYESRPIVFVHDEFICESPAETAPEAAEELARVMCAGAAEILPDVPIKAEPGVMRYWSKDAKSLRDEKGRLQAWPLSV